MSKWYHIDEKVPEQGQSVYYWFGVWDQVYEGKFEISTDPDFCGMKVFYGNSGFLGDDVTWWMPREELPEGIRFTPAPPSPEQKARCKYNPK